MIVVAILIGLLTGCDGMPAGSVPTPGENSSDAPPADSSVSKPGFPDPAPPALEPMDDQGFNALADDDKIYVAKKLYATLYKGVSLQALRSRIDSGDFISSMKSRLYASDIAQPDLDKIFVDDYTIPYAGRQGDRLFEKRWRIFSHIASTLYYTKLSRPYFSEWVAYMLAQTILFSPAYEVESVRPFPELVASNYQRLRRMVDEEKSIQEIAYEHMMSRENWARFRSPEDNAREMLEIWLYDYDDSHVPPAAQALKNWRWELRREKNAEGIYGNIYKFYNGTNNRTEENQQPVELLGKRIRTGEEFYRAIVEHPDFLPGVIERIVNLFFPTFSAEQKREIISAIAQAKPATFRELFAHILFSKKYLLQSKRIKTMEEVYMSLAHTLDMEPTGAQSFRYLFTSGMGGSNQEALTYKLGRLDEGVSDTDSVIRYHQYIRTNIFLKRGAGGWNSTMLKSRYGGDTVEQLLNTMFLDIVGRRMSADEESELVSIITDAGVEDMGSEWNRFAIMLMTFDYFSRLSEIYTYRAVGEGGRS